MKYVSIETVQIVEYKKIYVYNLNRHTLYSYLLSRPPYHLVQMGTCVSPSAVETNTL